MGTAERIAPLMVFFFLAACGGVPKNVVVLYPNPDVSAGSVKISYAGQDQVLDKAGFASELGDAGAPPSEPFAVKGKDVDDAFKAALNSQPVPPVKYILYFHFGTQKLTDESEAMIGEILAEIEGRPAPDVAVVGHTDRSGTQVINARLALRRANALKALLIKEGIEGGIVSVDSHGEHNPLIETAGGVYEPRNRRVEISVR